MPGTDISEDMTIPMFFFVESFPVGKELHGLSISDLAPIIYHGHGNPNRSGMGREKHCRSTQHRKDKYKRKFKSKNMELFVATGNQMIYLFTLILIGYILSKIGVLPQGTTKVLAILENYVLIPALVIDSFSRNFTVANLQTAGLLFISSCAILLALLPIALFVPKLLTRDRDIQKIYTYGLAISNYGFMGNSVVLALFPDIFMEYLIFTQPLSIAIYLWAIPQLLLPSSETETIKTRLKRFLNPTLIAMIIGMVIGMTGIGLPTALCSVFGTLGSCMSPFAMLLTGVTVATVPLKKLFLKPSVYVMSVIRLVVIPLAFLGIFALWNPSDTIVICAICSLAMPLGLNTLVIPSAYGKDPTTAAGMAVISHLCSFLTIPLIFLLLKQILPAL